MNRNYYLLFLAALLAGCGGGGDSKPNNTKTPTTITKQNRPQLKVEDTVLKFEGVGTVTEAKLSNVHGSVSYKVIDSNPPNVVKINDSGILQILRPGTATILATDSSSAYESSEARFSVTVERGINTELSVSDLNFNAIESEGKALTVRGQKGELSYEVESGHNLIRIDENGSVYSLGSVGQASVLITDSGNDFYLPKQVRAKVKLHAVAQGQLTFSPLEVEFREGLTLEPARLDKAQTQRISYKIIHSVPDNKVAELLDPETGSLLVHNVGQLTVEATAIYSDAFLDKQQTAQFFVDVKQGKRQEISVADIVTTYEEGGRIFPKVTNAYGDYELKIIRGEDVVAQTENGEALLIKGVGAAEVEIYEYDMRNYPASKTRFALEVNRAPHPVMKDVEMSLTYQPKLAIPMAFAGQKGKVSLIGGLPEGLRMKDGNLEVDTAGEYRLKFEDDGGDFYQPIQFNVVIKVAKAQGQAMTTQDYEMVYSKDYDFNLQRDFGLTASNDHLEVVDNTSPGVADVIGDGLIRVYKAGQTTLTVRRKESANYTAGPDQKIRFNILSAPSRIAIQSGVVEGTWNINQPYVQKPSILGTVGEVSYRFATDSATDVVSLDRKTGDMRILNAGSTRVIVSDAGNDKFTPGESSFAVTIKQGSNPVSITYPTLDFSAGAVITPVMSGGEAKASYRLINQAEPVVELLSSDSGRLKVLHAGDYQVEVTLTARNYTTKTVLVNGTINKADHPGLTTKLQTVEFTPFKTISLDFGKTVGTRTYAFADTVSEELATLDNAKAELTLTNYSQYHSIALDISESESRDYKALPRTRVTVHVDLAESGVADKYTQLDSEQTVIVSTLSAPQFSNLEESEFGIMGSRSVREPTDDELQKFGKGKVALFLLKPVGSDDRTQQKAVWVHVARFDGCTADLFSNDLKPFDAIDYDAVGYCANGSTIRMTRFLVIDDSKLENIEYELAAPVMYYRSGQREFLASDDGGFYAKPNVVYGKSKYGYPKSLYEWSVVTMKYQPN
ncbi:D-Tyr-tRNAtyr deacylase [Vibrio parahaemolyticus]|uniref:D-Tyr-tRNAtyr deacylase n=1 Tax=Vibrio parahaemolyticus TaxID=670 RepID=UPI0009F06F7C|nr:D-Tyr-tRNAtyr deacylase [Vibrio parahaemolyticus]OQU49887.1 D-Tyr-tRNAtyr deacylase [Vibrio parahaemolyticus]